MDLQFRVKTMPRCSQCSARSNGSGDGAMTFNLPDLRGRVAMGAGQGVIKINNDPVGTLSPRAIGDSLGEEKHTLTKDEMPSHKHDSILLADSRAAYGLGASKTVAIDGASWGSGVSAYSEAMG